MRGFPRRKQKQKTTTLLTNYGGLSLLVTLALFGGAGQAQAYPAQGETSKQLACAKVFQTEGDVRVLDQARVRTVTAVPGTLVNCGDWISVREGWVMLKHRDGHSIVMGRNTHVQARASAQYGEVDRDQWSLLDGEIYVDTQEVKIPVGVTSANTRAHIERAAALIIYDDAQEATQLVALIGHPTLSNRFQSGHPMRIQPGEATQLAFGDVRTMPSTPRALTQSELRRKLVSLQVEPPQAARYLKIAAARASRTVPKDLMHLMNFDHALRQPAAVSADQERQAAADYERHDLRDDEKAEFEALQMSRLTGRKVVVQKAKKHHAATGDHSELRTVTDAESRLEFRSPASLEVAGKVKSRAAHPTLKKSVEKIRKAETSEARSDANEKQRIMDELSRLRPDDN